MIDRQIVGQKKPSMTKKRATVTSLSRCRTLRFVHSHDKIKRQTSLTDLVCFCQTKLEAQYAAKRDAHLSEVFDLKQQLEMKANEIRSLNASIESLKSVNEELKVNEDPSRYKGWFDLRRPCCHLAGFRRNFRRYRRRQEPRRKRAGS